MYSARKRYSELTGDRNEFLNTAEDCARLTLPYLIKPEGDTSTHRRLITPGRHGAKCVSNLASKLMLYCFLHRPRFKLQVRDDKIGTELPPESVSWTCPSPRWRGWS